MYFLYKACDLADGSLDWVWAKGLVTTRLASFNAEARIQREVAARLEQAQAASANADVDL